MNQTTVTRRAKLLHGKDRVALCFVVVSVLILISATWVQAEEGLHLPLSALTCGDCDTFSWGERSYQAAPLPASAKLSSFETELVDLVNQERMMNGLAPLAIHPALRNAALAHSQDMSTNDFVGHVGSDGSTFVERLVRAGYANITAAGENIAAGYGSPGAVFDAWMSSASHRAIIMNPSFCDIGVGYVYEADDTYPDGWGYHHYWTQDFGAQASTTPSPTPWPTAMRTPTPTSGPASTTTYTPSCTATKTRTFSPQPSRTATHTPLRTATWTLTPTSLPSSTPTRPPTATHIPTWTRTPTPIQSPEGPGDPATVVGTVGLQARADKPNPCWRISLSVSLYRDGQLAAEPTVVYTDENGEFTLPAVLCGVYDIRVKNLHTLANIKHTVQLVAGLNRIGLGTLLEGDASDDNVIDILDFSFLRTSFGTNSVRSDFNQDGIVDVVDFSLLRAHFGLAGDITVP